MVSESRNLVVFFKNSFVLGNLKSAGKGCNSHSKKTVISLYKSTVTLAPNVIISPSYENLTANIFSKYLLQSLRDRSEWNDSQRKAPLLLLWMKNYHSIYSAEKHLKFHTKKILFLNGVLFKVSACKQLISALQEENNRNFLQITQFIRLHVF